MDLPDTPSGRSPRRELQLQGPRPTQLKVRKDSYKIRKPQVAAPPASEPQSHHHPPPPIIIYTVSPKIIHANPDEFKSLVQRLTGPGPNSSSSTLNISPPSSTSASSSAFAFQENSGGISPAARLASIENANSSERRKKQVVDHSHGIEMMEGADFGAEIQGMSTGQFPGILSPNPTTLPPIPQNFFSASSDHSNPLSFFPDLSTVLHSNRMNTSSPNTSDIFSTLFDI